tara:strand:- start:135 stop:398 length:264 start_codon:yes stop_codon:yes gene_type:complete
MSYTIKIDKFQNDILDGEKRKLIGFRVTKDVSGEVFIIDKWLDIDASKSDDTYSADAFKLCKTEIDEWEDSFVNVAKTFNPETGKIE